MAIAEPQTYMERITWDGEVGNDPLDPGPHTYHGMIVNGVRVGMVKIAPHGAGIIIANLWVRPECRRRGHARAMLVRVLQRYGARPLFVRPEPFDGGPYKDALAGFYADHGFADPVAGVMIRQGK